MTSVLLRQQLEGVLTLTLNRPEQLNALTWELMRLLNEALEAASVDPGVRVVVLAGTGRGFCSGGDLRSREQLDPGDPVSVRWSEDPVWKSVGMRASHVGRLSRSPILLHTMPKPTIAAIVISIMIGLWKMFDTMIVISDSTSATGKSTSPTTKRPALPMNGTMSRIA